MQEDENVRRIECVYISTANYSCANVWFERHFATLLLDHGSDNKVEMKQSEK